MDFQPGKPTLGLRLIAIFELIKGTIGLAVGLGLIAVAEHHVPSVIKSIVRHSRLIESGHTPHYIVEMIHHPDDPRIMFWAVLAILYSVIRFTEAYGLWLARRWGEWLALVSVGLYVPFEIYTLTRGLTVVKVSVLLINLILLWYLVEALKATRRKRAAGFAAGAAAPENLNSNVPQG